MSENHIDIEQVFEAFKDGAYLTDREWESLMDHIGGPLTDSLQEEMRRERCVTSLI